MKSLHYALRFIICLVLVLLLSWLRVFGLRILRLHERSPGTFLPRVFLGLWLLWVLAGAFTNMGFWLCVQLEGPEAFTGDLLGHVFFFSFLLFRRPGTFCWGTPVAEKVSMYWWFTVQHCPGGLFIAPPLLCTGRKSVYSTLPPSPLCGLVYQLQCKLLEYSCGQISRQSETYLRDFQTPCCIKVR